jgi:hypothetical protein
MPHFFRMQKCHSGYERSKSTTTSRVASVSHCLPVNICSPTFWATLRVAQIDDLDVPATVQSDGHPKFRNSKSPLFFRSLSASLCPCLFPSSDCWAGWAATEILNFLGGQKRIISLHAFRYMPKRDDKDGCAADDLRAQCILCD